jgi:hypothetical protein
LRETTASRSTRLVLNTAVASTVEGECEIRVPENVFLLPQS